MVRKLGDDGCILGGSNHEIVVQVRILEASTIVVAVASIHDGDHPSTESATTPRSLTPERNPEWVILPRHCSGGRDVEVEIFEFVRCGGRDG